MASDDIRIKLKAFLDSSGAQKDIDAFVDKAQKKPVEMKVTVDIDEGDSQQKIQSAINKIRNHGSVKFPIDIDTKGMDQSFRSFNEQIENYKRTVKEAGGTIKKMEIVPQIETSVWADGQEHIEETYKALITYQTAVGETVQQIITLNTATGEVSQSTGKMSVNFDKQRKDFIQLSSAIEAYTAKLNALKEKARAVLGGTADTNAFKALVDSVDFSKVGNMEELDTMVAKLKQAQAEFDRLNASITNKKLAGTSIEQINQNLERMPDRIAEIRSRFSDIQIPDTIRQQLEFVEQQLQNIRNIEAPDQFIAAYNQLNQILDSVPSRLKVIQSEQRQMTQNALEQQRAQDRLNSLIARYQAAATRYSAFKSNSSLVAEYKALGNTIEQLQQRMQQVKQTGVWDKSITSDVASANAQMSQFNNHVVMAGKNAKSLKDTFKEAFSTFGTWLSATTVVMKLLQGIKNAITSVKELDAAMVDLKKVTDETDQAYAQYLRNVGEQAQRIGSTMTDLIASGATFAKLGYSFKEAQGLAEVATIFANVGDFSNINVATNGLITAMKAFNIAADDAMSVADKINEVANHFAVSADDLTTGLANSASALNLAGNTIDQSIAMITAMSEITQNASESGNALKILSMRLRGAKADLASAGEDTDGMCDSVSSLREKIMALTGGIDIMADEAGTQFKSTYQIMQEISQVWNDLTDINQAALLETIAGKMRGNSISALLTNMAQANKVLETSLDSAGSALKEHENWMEGIAAKEAQMKAAWQDFSDSFISRDAIAGVYEGLTGILNILTAIIDKAGTLPTLLGGLATVLSVKGNWLGVAQNSAGDIVGRIGKYTSGSGGFSFDKMINGVVDNNIIDQYTSALNDGASAADAMKQAVMDASGQVINLNGATRQALATQNGAAAAMRQLGIATTATTVKMVAQRAAIMALNVALNIGLMAAVTAFASGVSALIEKIGTSIDKARNPLKYLKEEYEVLTDSYSDISTQVDDVNDELASTNSRIDELQRKGKLTFVEKEELNRLKASNDELDRRLANLKEQQDLQKKDIAANVKARYKEEFQNTRYDNKDDPWYVWADSTDYTRETFIGWDLQRYRNLPPNNAFDNIRKRLVDAMEEYYQFLDEYPYEDEFSAYLQEQIEDIYKVIHPGEFKSSKFDEIINSEDFQNTVLALKTAASNGELNSTLVESYSAFNKALAEVDITAEEAVEQFYALAASEKVAVENATSFSSLNTQFQSIVAAQTKLAEISQAQGYATSITEEQYQEITAMGEEYAKCVENINGFVALNIDKVNQLVQAKYAEQKAEVAVSKAQAMTQYKQNVDEIALLEAELTLLTAGEDELSASIQAQISALQSQNGVLLDDIAGYERLTSQLQYATSAYKKWLDAQNAPEAGEAYDNLFKAMGQIKEGRENGKIGTAKYKAAVELLVPDGRDVSSYMKTLERYLTEDSTGLQHFIDDMYKSANPFLSKDASGKYSFMEGVTVEDIARGLGLTDEVAQYMITALKDYGWDVSMFDNDFKDSALVESYNSAVDKLAEAQNKLNELRQSGAATAEELAAQEKAVADAQQEVDTAAIAAGLQEEKTAIEQLKDELAELQAAYDTLKELKLTGDIDPLFNDYAASIISVIDTLSGMPEGGYKIDVTTGEGLEDAIAQANAIQSAISDLDKLADAGVISYGLAASLTEDTLSPALETIKANIDEYNKKQIETKTADLVDNVTPGLTTAEAKIDEYNAKQVETKNADANDNVSDTVDTVLEKIDEYNKVAVEDKSVDLTINLDDQASSKIDEIEKGPYAAVINVSIDPTDEATIENKLKEWNEALEAERDETDEKGEQTQNNGIPQAPDNLALALGAKVIDEVFGTDLSGGLSKHDVTQESGKPKETPEIKPFKPEDYGFKSWEEQLKEQTQEAIEEGTSAGLSEGFAQNQDESVWQMPPINLEVNTDKAEKAVEELSSATPKQFADYDTPLEKLTAFSNELKSNGSQFEDAISSLGTSWEEVKQAYLDYQESIGEPLSPELDDRQILDSLNSLMEEWNGKEMVMGLKADPSNAIRTANSAVSTINGKTATITINGKYSGLASLLSLPKFAKGTHYAKEEDAIVGESGIETWIHDGQFYTVGHNGAELVHLSRGDQVLNPSETKALFNGKRMSGNAYGTGTGGSFLQTVGNTIGNVFTGVVNGVKNFLSSISASSTNTAGGGYDLGGKAKEEKNKEKNNNGGGGGNSKEEEAESYLDTLDDLVDWIPTAIENLKKKTDEYIDYADKAVGYMLKNSNLDSAINNISDEISLNLQAYDRYMRQANEIAQRMSLSADIVSKIQNGTIDINSYDEDTRKVISAYQKWYDLAIGCRDAVADLKDQQYELAKQKLDNITKYYDNRITLLGTVFDSYQKQIDKKIASGKEVIKNDYSDMISNTQEQIDMLQQERNALSNELKALVDAGTIKVGSDDWYEYTNQIKAFDNTISDAQISIEEFKDSANSIVLTNMQTAMSMLEHVHSTIQGLMDLRSAQGKTATAGDYRDLISSGTKQIRNLEVQNAALLEQQQGLDVLSEKYQEIQKQINENAQTILSTKAKQEEWNDAIIDLEIDRLQKQNTQYKSQLELMDAIENLEKAKQRRALVYRDGRGFDYESMGDEIDSAKKTVEDLLFDQTIQRLEDSKRDSNLYDDYGNELSPILDTLPGLNFSPYYASVLSGNERSGLLSNALSGLDYNKLIASGAAAAELSVTIENGAITLSGVNNVNELAEAITNQLPNALLQELYKD